jgi:ADP-ribosyl-[dinitrogen reductase] hydrolase
LTSLADRAVGSVLGLALGDAAGAPFESRRAHEIPIPLPVLELPWRGGPPGSTTDDTAMARNLVRSLGDRGRFDPGDVVERHMAWYRTDPPDVGTFTRRVLERVARGEPAPDAARSVWEERGPEVSAGNGSVMYCAPLGVAYANRPIQLYDLAPLLSSLTHHDERCRTACLAVTLVVAALVRGDPPERSLHEVVTSLIDQDRPGAEELEFLVEAAGTKRPVDGPDQGFCLFAAALGLQAVVTDQTIEEGIRRVIALGGDTDTNAAVAGALLAAREGATTLPQTWMVKLEDREQIQREAEALAVIAEATS